MRSYALRFSFRGFFFPSPTRCSPIALPTASQGHTWSAGICVRQQKTSVARSTSHERPGKSRVKGGPTFGVRGSLSLGRTTNTGPESSVRNSAIGQARSTVETSFTATSPSTLNLQKTKQDGVSGEEATHASCRVSLASVWLEVSCRGEEGDTCPVTDWHVWPPGERLARPGHHHGGQPGHPLQ